MGLDRGEDDFCRSAIITRGSLVDAINTWLLGDDALALPIRSKAEQDLRLLGEAVDSKDQSRR